MAFIMYCVNLVQNGKNLFEKKATIADQYLFFISIRKGNKAFIFYVFVTLQILNYRIRNERWKHWKTVEKSHNSQKSFCVSLHAFWLVWKTVEAKLREMETCFTDLTSDAVNNKSWLISYFSKFLLSSFWVLFYLL